MKNHKFKKVILVTNTLTAGGAENMLLNLARSLQRQGFKVDLISTSNVEDFFPVPEGISRIKLDESSHQIGFFKPFFRAIKLRNILKNSPDATAISFLENVNILLVLSSLFLPNKTIISMRNHPAMKKVSLPLSVMRKILYPKASLLVVQTDSIKKWCLEHGLHKKIAIIPNFLADDYLKKIPHISPENETFHFVAAGRLVPQKGFDLLINAAINLKGRGERFQISVFGEGPELARLENMISSNNLQEEISFKPATKKLHEEIARADAFILSSRFEGFPNVLLEAMSQGKPVVSFDCPSGPKEIINDGIDGILVPPENTSAMADKMQLILNNFELRNKLAHNALSVRDRFSEGAVMKQWLSLISE